MELMEFNGWEDREQRSMDNNVPYRRSHYQHVWSW